MQMTKFWTVYIIRFVSIFFVVSVIIASYFFPGGNIHNPDQIGYSFSHNFLSELGGYITFAGDINSISSFFLTLRFFVFYWSEYQVFSFHHYLQKIMFHIFVHV